MSKNYTEAEFEFYLAIKTDNNNFSAQLARLILKADPTNRMILAGAYPEMCKVAFDYQDKPKYWEDLQARIMGGNDNG